MQPFLNNIFSSGLNKIKEVFFLLMEFSTRQNFITEFLKRTVFYALYPNISRNINQNGILKIGIEPFSVISFYGSKNKIFMCFNFIEKELCRYFAGARIGINI